MLLFCMYMKINNIDSFNNFYTSNNSFKNFKQNNNNIYLNNCEIKKQKNLKVKVGVISTAIASTIAVLYSITKNKGLKPFSNFNIFKQEISPKNMLQITGISVPASILAGIILDKKENVKPKLKEGVSQMVGNIFIPILTVCGSVKLKDYINNKNFNNKICNTLKNSHKAVFSSIGLISGLFIGNKTANYINSKIFDNHNERPIKIKDFSAHLDDICFATSLIFKDNKIGTYASKFIPATLLVSAYEAGTKSN